MLKNFISYTLRVVPRPVLQRVSYVPLKVASLFLSGNNKECPVCERSFSRFLPYGRLKSSRANALCPNCLALERHRLMYLYLKERTDFFTAPKKVLHVAPEHCFIDRFEKIHGEGYITADIESPLAKVKMDIHAIPFPDNTFDVIFCNHVLEHVDDYPQAIRELRRVLKPGGWGIVQSPQDWSRPHTFEDSNITDPAERERIFWQNDHLRLFGQDYGSVLAESGFQVTEDRFVFELSPDRVTRYALPSKEVVYFCRK